MRYSGRLHGRRSQAMLHDLQWAKQPEHDSSGCNTRAGGATTQHRALSRVASRLFFCDAMRKALKLRCEPRPLKFSTCRSSCNPAHVLEFKTLKPLRTHSRDLLRLQRRDHDVVSRSKSARKRSLAVASQIGGDRSDAPQSIAK